MGLLKEINLNEVDLEELELWVHSLEDVFPFKKDSKKSALVMCYSMARELGGINDNLALHIYNASSGRKVNRSSLKGVLVESRGLLGVKVTSFDVEKIEVRIPGFDRFLQQTRDGFILFPELAADYLIDENIETVLVKKWLLNTTFSNIDPKKILYKDDMWELIENDAFTYASLIAKRQMVLQGLHDLVDHAANANSDGWTCASEIAAEMCDKFSNYFQKRPQGNIPSHLIPFAAGVILDEMTQMPHYLTKGRISAIRFLLEKIDVVKIDPFSPLMLNDFPASIDSVTEAARNYREDLGLESIRASVDLYANDVIRLTYQ